MGKELVLRLLVLADLSPALVLTCLAGCDGGDGEVRAYLMVDTYPAVRTTLTIP